MLETLCAVIAMTIIGLTWHIWRPILVWGASIAVVLAAMLLAIGIGVWLWQLFADGPAANSKKAQEVLGVAIGFAPFLLSL